MPIESNGNAENQEVDLRPAEMLRSMLQAYLDAETNGISSEIADRIRALLGETVSSEDQSPLASIGDLWRALDIKFCQYGVGRHLGLQCLNGVYSLAGCEGRIQVLPNHALVQVDDPKRLMAQSDSKQKTLVSSFIEVANGLRGIAAEDFKAHVDLMDDLSVFAMDPGMHKEFLVCLAPSSDKAGCVFYRHIKSTHERGQPNIRAKYIKGCLEGFEIHEDDLNISAIKTFRSDGAGFLNESKRMMRLAASVKDLDLLKGQETDVPKMIGLFNAGVLNMGNLWNSFKEKRTRKYSYGINEDEQKLIKEHLARRSELSKGIEEKYGVFKRVIDLNYEALALLAQLQELIVGAFPIDESVAASLKKPQVPSSKLSDAILSQFKQLRDKVMEMAKAVGSMHSLGSLSGVAERFFDSQKTRNALDEIVQAGRHGAFRHRYLRPFLDRLSSEKGAGLSEENVESVQELIRLFHVHAIGLLAQLHRGYTDREEGMQFFHSEFSGMSWVDLTSDGIGKSMIFSEFEKVRQGISDRLWNLNLGKANEEMNGLFAGILGGHFMEIHMQCGEHSVQIVAQGEKGGHLIAFRLYESKFSRYYEDIRRIDFLRCVLEQLGFKCQIKDMTLTADCNSKNSKEWVFRLKEVFRLSLVSNNMDLHERLPNAAPMFLGGVNEIGFVQHELDVLKESETPNFNSLKKWLNMQELFQSGEIQWLVRSLFEEVCGKDKKLFKEYLMGLNEGEFDRVLSAIFEIADGAKREKDKKKYRYYVHFGDELGEFYDELFPKAGEKMSQSEQASDPINKGQEVFESPKESGGGLGSES